MADGGTEPDGCDAPQRVSSADSRRPVREWPCKRPVDGWRVDEMPNATRRERGIVRGNVRCLTTTDERRDPAASTETAAGGAIVFGGRGRVVAGMRSHRHPVRAVRVRRSRDGRVHLAGVNARRFEKRGIEPHGPKTDQGAKPEGASHNL